LGRLTLVAEYEVVGVDSVRLEADVNDMCDGGVDVLATRATTTHGASVLVVVVVVVAAAAADHVRAFQRLYDRRVPVTRALNLHTRAFLHRESKNKTRN